MGSKNYVLLALLFSSIISLSFKAPGDGEQKRTMSFDDHWRFLKDNPAGAMDPSFDDSKWTTLDLPHDWSINDLPNQIPDSIIGPFSKASDNKMRTGYTVGGTAWYRKSFTIDKKDEQKIAYLQFDGVYMNSDMWINGKHVGSHPYGYTSFYYNITPYLNPAGKPNLVAVRVKKRRRQRPLVFRLRYLQTHMAYPCSACAYWYVGRICKNTIG